MWKIKRTIEDGEDFIQLDEVVSLMYLSTTTK